MTDKRQFEKTVHEVEALVGKVCACVAIVGIVSLALSMII